MLASLERDLLDHESRNFPSQGARELVLRMRQEEIAIVREALSLEKADPWDLEAIRLCSQRMLKLADEHERLILEQMQRTPTVVPARRND